LDKLEEAGKQLGTAESGNLQRIFDARSHSFFTPIFWRPAFTSQNREHIRARQPLSPEFTRAYVVSFNRDFVAKVG
jgi:hypothetical protein